MLRIFDKHAGNKPNNGGEYSAYRNIVEQDGKIFVELGTSAEFSFCPVFGTFQDCLTCTDYEWTGEYMICHAEKPATQEELMGIANEIGMTLDDLISKVKEAKAKDEWLRIDNTGHKPVYCQNGAGCIICHPCTCCEQPEIA